MIVLRGGRCLLDAVAHVHVFAWHAKHFLDIEASDRAGLKVLFYVVLVAKSACSFLVNFSQIHQIRLASNQIDQNVGRGVSPNIVQPGAQVVESVFSCQIKAKENDVGSFVKDASDRAEGLLASCVPDL